MVLQELTAIIKDRYSKMGYHTTMIEEWLMLIAGQAGHCAVFFLGVPQLRIHISRTLKDADNAIAVDLDGPDSFEEVDKLIVACTGGPPSDITEEICLRSHADSHSQYLNDQNHKKQAPDL